LIIFDRLFGTYVAEPEEGGLRYGLTQPVTSHNPFVIATHQWRVMAMAFAAATSWQARWRVLSGRPSDLDHLPDGQPHAVTSAG
ncbi:MAG: hypothetical protein ACKVOJ_13510, partial [Sphingomonadaceae bacterium]